MHPEDSSRIFIKIQKYPTSNQVKVTMNALQLKIVRHENQENITHNEGKNNPN